MALHISIWPKQDTLVKISNSFWTPGRCQREPWCCPRLPESVSFNSFEQFCRNKRLKMCRQRHLWFASCCCCCCLLLKRVNQDVNYITIVCQSQKRAQALFAGASLVTTYLVADRSNHSATVATGSNKTLLQVQLDSLGRSTLLWIIKILDSLSGDGRVFIVWIP